MTAPSGGSLVRRGKEFYDNLPLPLPVVAAIVLDLLLARLRPVPVPGSPSLHRMAGAGLLLAGVGLNLWALAERRHRTAGPFALERPEELVTTGPYAITRHPMYVGWWLIQLGAGTLAGSSWVLATLPAELIVEHRGVLGEEAMLTELFGRSYLDYAERVPRYLGSPFRAQTWFDWGMELCKALDAHQLRGLQHAVLDQTGTRNVRRVMVIARQYLQRGEILSLATAQATPPRAVSATGILGFAAAGVFAVVLPRLRHRRNY
ncbi:methyltransferase family protein [Pseudarthrobacter cellobiosi]|uniref:methyltransferase family protein n=1 Tax=Pseudarthrobacter cellobiosi TaxID=2953654 RepID=UPI00208F4FEB|nr:isoprenylcysteine carboxylmethyltransferase family protein [Pseudarthrobacter sp. HLT1-5]MCO4253861.1 isoprenylcysteine carboxylmethyltransferase family protein [Pseudarthrobacter sp. HLT1-5]